MSEKIRSEHLQRGAFVYVRQSTPYQVCNHLEGKGRQYALAERAKQLGFTKVVVIDEDLDRSGSGSQERMGFGRLLASVARAWLLNTSLRSELQNGPERRTKLRERGVQSKTRKERASLAPLLR